MWPEGYNNEISRQGATVPPYTGDQKSTKIDHSGELKRRFLERPPGSDPSPGGPREADWLRLFGLRF